MDSINLSMLTGLSTSNMLWLALIVFFAALLRGYSGFGLSAMVVAGSSLITPTREAVPLVLLLEVFASVQMAAGVWKFIRWDLIRYFVLAAAFMIPLGQWLLVHIDIESMRTINAILLLLVIVLTLSSKTPKLPASPRGWFFIGGISGFMNGLLAMGGIWAIMLLLGVSIAIAQIRASLVAVFFAYDGFALIVAYFNGILGTEILFRALFLMPCLSLGIAIGSYFFDPDKAKHYRNVVYGVLSALALSLVIRQFF